jgi:hypothetical protein
MDQNFAAEGWGVDLRKAGIETVAKFSGNDIVDGYASQSGGDWWKERRGEYAGGVMTGFGMVTFRDGRTWVGHMVAGCLSGAGAEFNADGTIASQGPYSAKHLPKFAVCK